MKNVDGGASIIYRKGDELLLTVSLQLGVGAFRKVRLAWGKIGENLLSHLYSS